MKSLRVLSVCLVLIVLSAGHGANAAMGDAEFSGEMDLTLGVSAVSDLPRKALVFPRGLLNLNFPSARGNLFSGSGTGGGTDERSAAFDAFLSAEFRGADSTLDGGGIDTDPYRWWFRGIGRGWEATLGLQKISYGHCRVYRPMALFDNISFNDLTRRTDGVEALKIRLFPTDRDELHGWLIGDSSNYGGRYNRILQSGEAGVTFHHRSGDKNLPDEKVYGIDMFFDIKIGLWCEIVRHDYDIFGSSTLYCLGFDYTFERIGNGLHIGMEHLVARAGTTGNSATSTIFWDIPINAEMHHFGMLFRDSLTGVDGLNFRLVRDAGGNTTTEWGIQWLSNISMPSQISGGGPAGAGSGNAWASVGLARALTFRVVRNF